MKLLLAFFLLMSSTVFAVNGSENVVKCQDARGRTLTIDRLTGTTGGFAGSYLAVVLYNGKSMGIPQPVMKSQTDVTFPTTFSAGNLEVSIPSVQNADIPATQVRGTVKTFNDTAPIPMLCNKGPAFLK